MKQKKLLKLISFVLLILSVGLLSFVLAKIHTPQAACQPGYQFQSGGIETLTLAALADSINPCALAVLLILLEGLILIRKNILATGLAFVAGIFISYLLIGLGLLTGLTLINNANIFHLIISVAAILIGILNIKDYFWYGLGIRMEIPIAWRPRLGSIINRAVQPLLAFLIGFLISFFELPCTGGPYLFAMGLLKGQPITLSLFSLLVYYNLIFILPLVIIIIGIHFSYLKIERVQEWRKKNIRLFHLVGGVILLGIGCWLLASSI